MYDSPIAPHNPASAGTYTSSVYSQDEANNAPPAHYNTQAPQYQSYNPSAPDQAPPPMPTGAPPQAPHDGMTPLPLQPAGAAYDPRHGHPGQPAAGAGQQPQYKPYVPPGQTDGSGAPSDYYRQSGVY